MRSRVFEPRRVIRDAAIFLLTVGWMASGCGGEGDDPIPEGMGGVGATGGWNTGGSGGFPTGGFPTGGFPTGGFPTGGFPTGGVATGGIATGGLGTGGYCYHYCDQPCSACH